MALLLTAPAVAETAVDPSMGPWWQAPTVELTFQPQENDATDPAGFLLPIVDLDRSRQGYRISLSSSHVMAGETRPLPECATAGSVEPIGAGRFVGEAGRFGRVLLNDLGGGVVRIDFERVEGCARSGRYLAVWAAPH